jgi:hypothetical protein
LDRIIVDVVKHKGTAAAFVICPALVCEGKRTAQLSWQCPHSQPLVLTVFRISSGNSSGVGISVDIRQIQLYREIFLLNIQ